MQGSIKVASTDLSTLPEPGPARAELVDARIAMARQARVEDGEQRARDLIEESIRAGLWRYGRLWSELWALMTEPADYHRIRTLWWDTPRSCQSHIPVLRTVARAASVAGVHDDARALLRRAIVVQAYRSRRLRPRLRRLASRTAPRQLTSRLRGTPSFESNAAVALRELNELLGEVDVKGFLISGTLLGLVRDAQFISWDKDIDLGFFSDDIEAAQLKELFERSGNFHLRLLDFTSHRLRVNHDNGTMIDIFPHYRDDEQGLVWHDGTATRWWNKPFTLTRRPFLGADQWVPDPPEQYLDENYGDWRTPEPNFDARLDAPNVEVKDAPFLDTLLFFSLLDAVAKQQPAKKARYTALLRERGEGEWLHRL